jgi:uroporphyrin-III C-methyltransferase/precorrin-2 dehydrogenase/sirohydrochlorin ferrochelatase
MQLFPIFLNLTGKAVLLVGGGPVAASKLAALQAAGADITVVAPEVSSAIAASGVRIVTRGFQPGDVEGQWLIVAAAPPEVNRAVADAARARQIFVNAVDDPAHADAYLGGVVRRAGVTIAISTDGRAPALAGLLREGLDAMLPADLDRWMAEADAMRRHWKATGVPMDARRPQLLNALIRLYALEEALSTPVTT